MQTKTKFLIILAHFFLASCAQSKFILYQEGRIQPLIYSEHTSKEVAAEFVGLFKKLGISLKTTNSELQLQTVGVQLLIDKNVKSFHLLVKGKHLIISGSSTTNLRKALRYFFSTYTSLNQFTANNKSLSQPIITLPLDLNYQSNVALSYIEPYFAENFSEEFRLWNNTNTLEDSWALWGHNIGKFIKVTPAMFAIVDGKINDEQLNFASVELENALSAAIEEKLADDPQVSKFMIMPYDNELVCVCEACVKLGNTKTNASPAVYALIEKLAASYPKAMFFSTAYITTETPPKTISKENIGVMISTMSFPKGIVLETSNKAETISKKFKDWQAVTKNIYLWDYAINFDNYFDFYPTVSIAQKNLKFYLINGVKGIFMHGSDEGSFAAFGDLKAYLYAQLYNNPTVNLNTHIELFLINKYPVVGQQLSNFYTRIEEEAFKSNKQIDIYGGINQSVKKYLSYDELNVLLMSLLAKKESVLPTDRRNFDLILMAFVFQHLELQRTNGLSANGYGTYINGKRNLKPKLENQLQLLKQLSVSNNIEIYNESNLKLSDYITSWERRIVGVPYKNLFYKKAFKVISKLDEEYKDTSTLNDGAIGFQDYYNNWLINSSPSFELESDVVGMEKATTLKIDFLYDRRHKIYPPETVTVNIGDRKYETSVNWKKAEDDEIKFVSVEIPLQIKATDAEFKISIKKQAQPQKRLIAFDEIIFN